MKEKTDCSKTEKEIQETQEIQETREIQETWKIQETSGTDLKNASEKEKTIFCENTDSDKTDAEEFEVYLHYKPKIERLCPMDDDFACCLFRDDPEFLEKILKIILKRDIKIVKIETQVDIKQPDESKELIFDIIGTDEAGNKYNIEIQRDNRGATPVRGEAHFIVIGHESLRKGFRIENLPNIYILFITENDI